MCIPNKRSYCYHHCIAANKELWKELWGKSCYKVEQVIYYKVGQSLLQSGVGIIRWGNFIAKWGYYYRKSQYIFVTQDKWRPMFTDSQYGAFQMAQTLLERYIYS